LGHQVVFIVGDFTGQIGDTSDKDAERPMLSEDEIQKNLETYFDQAYKILIKDKTEVYYNSTWLKDLGFAEIGKLANLFGMHEFSTRDNIAKRLKAGKRVSLRELLYPLMQGYDSVAVRADVELGGTDQRFNLLAGRTIQEAYGQKAQDVLMMELLEGTDGRKMSSSWGNTINLTDSAEIMFGKAMSVPDNLMDRYFKLATKTRADHIEELKKSYENPRDLKMILAHTIVEQYHGANAARKAQEAFVSQFSKKELPSDIKEVKVKAGDYALTDLLVKLNLVSSKSEAVRMILQGGVKINQQKISPETKGNSKSIVVPSVKIGTKNNLILQVGKRKFIKIK
jgi:tyrosyl-tRNA synthetase